MGMFDSFLGKGRTGYTAAQSAGLARSEEIKKKRKADQRAFEREKLKAETSAAAAEGAKERMSKELISARGEIGATKRAAMTQAGATKRQGMSDIAETGRVTQRGWQASDLSAQGAEQTAIQKSMDARRRLSEVEVKAGAGRDDYKSFTSYGGEPGFYSPSRDTTKYPQSKASVGERARGGLTAPAPTSLVPKKKKKAVSWEDY